MRMQAVRADWILDDSKPQGLDFLRSLTLSRNNELFDTPYVKIIIQFLYSRFRAQIMKRKLPLYVIHLASVVTMFILNDM